MVRWLQQGQANRIPTQHHSLGNRLSHQSPSRTQYSLCPGKELVNIHANTHTHTHMFLCIDQVGDGDIDNNYWGKKNLYHHHHQFVLMDACKNNRT